MKSRVFAVVAILAILFSTFGVGNVNAGAYETQFTSAVTYMNVGTGTTTTLKLYFYADPADVTPTSYTLPNLAPNAAGALFIGGLDDSVVADGFQGSAYMESDQVMLVTLVQIPMGSTTVKNRGMTNGFMTGGPTALIATVLKGPFNPPQYTIFSVQNADTVANNISIKFYDQSANNVHTINTSIAPGAAYYVDAGLVAALPLGFNGSAVVTAQRSDLSNGAIVASALELDSGTGVGVKAFEGVAAGSSYIYMPSAMCDAFPSSAGSQDSAYAIQNTSLSSSTTVTVTYKTTTGGTYTDTKVVGPGAKGAFLACGVIPSGQSGSAIIESSTTPVVAIGKVYGQGLTTAFLGVDTGFDTLALPYVRWADNTNWFSGAQQRTYIAIQNVGPLIPEDEVITVQYVDYAGVVRGTHTITIGVGGLATGAKISSNASSAGLTSFGYYGTIYGGAAIITGPGGSQLAAIGRVASYLGGGYMAAEDYNAQPK